MEDQLYSNIPALAYVPKTPLWIPSFKTGKWTPSNGNTVDWTVNKIKNLFNNTKAWLAKGNRIYLKPEHIRTGHLAGIIDDVKLEGDTILAKAAWLTPNTAEEIKTGKWITQSAEINTQDNIINAVALLGNSRPALDTLPSIDSNFSSGEPSLLDPEIFIFDNITIRSDNMADNEKKKIEDTKPDDKVKTFSEKEYNELKVKLEEQEKQLTELNAKEEQETTDQYKQMETLLQAQDKTIKDMQFKQEFKDLFQIVDKFNLPGENKSDIVKALMETDNQKVLLFSEDNKASDRAYWTSLLSRFSARFDKLTESSIDIEKTESAYSAAVSVSADYDKADAIIEKFKEENKLSYDAAMDKCIEKKLIKD